VITGQTGINSTTSSIKVWVRAINSSNHSADEHFVDGPVLFAGNVANNVGFTIYARAMNRGKLYGNYNIAYEWN
jgi:hypothetical protein